MQGAFAVVRGGSSSSNLLEPHHLRDSKVCRVLEFGVVRIYGTFSNYILDRGNKVCRVLVHKFGVVQAHRTSSNLLEPQHRRDSKVCRVLLHEFGMVREGSKHLNHPTLVHKHPAHLVSPVKM